MDDPNVLEQFLSSVSPKGLDQLKGLEIKRLCSFLEEELPALLVKFPQWFITHPSHTRKFLDLCQWTIEKGIKPYQMAEYARRLRCILAVAEAKRLNLHTAHHELLLAAGIENERAERNLSIGLRQLG